MSSPLIRKIYGPRPPWCHKGDYGKLLVVGGSRLYSGSPIFNALAAYRAGCDLVKIAAPEAAAAAAKTYLPDLIAYPLEGDYLSKKHLRIIFEMQKEADAMVIGGGLTRNKAVLDAITAVIKKTKLPTVIDADAIHAVADDARKNWHSSVGQRGSPSLAPRSSFHLGKNFVVTPHSYEFYKLSGKRVGSNIEERKKLTREFALRFGSVVLLKGHIDVISDGRKIATNKTGNAFMTKGGFGDTLAGICGALLARHVSAFDAACAAAYINGRAGDLAAKKFGEGILASDLLWDIPNVIR